MSTGSIITNEENSLQSHHIDDKDRLIVEIADLSTDVKIAIKEISFYYNKSHSLLFKEKFDKKMKIVDFKKKILEKVPKLESIHEFIIREEGHWSNEPGNIFKIIIIII
jgi:hypothetical protein